MSRPYPMLALNLLLSFAVMYLVMFAMIDGWADFYNNLNTFYMALAMVAPMGALMLLTMGHMYEDRRTNLILYLAFAGLFAIGFGATRLQAGIGDRQFLRSMIPHHSGAILMCRQARLADQEIVDLCVRIQRSQREEIDQMNRILARY